MEPQTDNLGPFATLFGGENGAPAQQFVNGQFSEVPKAEVNTPLALGAFSDLVPQTATSTAGHEDLGPFSELVKASPTAETEKALSDGKPPDEESAVSRFLGIRELGLDKFKDDPIIPPALMKAAMVYPYAADALSKMFPENKAVQYVKGGTEGLTETLSGFTTPSNIALIGSTAGAGKAAQVLLAAGFEAMAIKHLPEQWAAFNNTSDASEKAKLAVQIVAGLGLPVLGGVSAALHQTPKTVRDSQGNVNITPAGASEAPAATMERPAQQTQSGAERVAQDGVRGEVADVREVPPEVRPAANAREIEPGTTAAIAELERRNALSTEPIIPNEPAGTKFPAPEVAQIPEYLKRNPEVDRLINEPEAQTGPQMKMAPATEGGALGFGGGKRPTVTAKGTTPRGDTEFLRIESGPRRILKGLEREGAADIIGRSKNKVAKLLSEATNTHVDMAQELTGRLSTMMTEPVKGLSAKVIDKAYDEIPAYWAAKENGRPLPTISPTAQKLVTAWEDIAEKTGKIMSANDVRVFDPALGKYRPSFLLGKDFVQRLFKEEVEQVLRDRNKNAPLWNDLVVELQKDRGISEAEATKIMQAKASQHTSSGFMGSIDMARTGKMPESWYEYDLRNIASRYIPQFSERMAQIIAFGQRLGPREAPVRPNLWDIARNETADVKTQELLNVMEDQATNVRPKTAGGRFMAGAQTLATGTYLTSPKTTIRNLISGITSTPELLGVRRSTQALAKVLTNKNMFADAKEIGVIQDSMASVLHADKLNDAFLHDVIRAGTDKALKISGQSGSESFVRTVGFVAADLFAKDAVVALNKKPTSMQSKEALGLFKRMGVSPEKIVAENAKWQTGPETRKFIRTFVRETQGGYRYNQVPVWANSNNGRFIYQFGRWGTMRWRNMVRNAIKPAFGEEVQWHGKTMTRVDFRPLIKMAMTPVILGETFAAIEQLMFGRDRSDSSTSEIVAAWKEDEKKAIMMAIERVANDVIMAGSLGILGQPLDWARSVKGQSRLKNPTEPPGLGSIRALIDLGQKALDQGLTVTRKDVLEFTKSFVPGVKQVRDIYRNVMDEDLYEAENDVRTLRSAAVRWANQTKMDVSPRGKGDFRKSALAPEYEPIKEALLVGDANRANFLTKIFLDKASNREEATESLKMSVKQSQPFRAGPYTAQTHRDKFREWARKNLNEDDYNQTERIQKRYQQAAVAAGLW